VIQPSRRGLILGAAALMAAPAIVRYGNIMPVRSFTWTNTRSRSVTLPSGLRDGAHLTIRNWADKPLNVFLPGDDGFPLPIAKLRPGEEIICFGGAEGSYIVTSSLWDTGAPEVGHVMKDIIAVGP